MEFRIKKEKAVSIPSDLTEISGYDKRKSVSKPTKP
jgi:hypothetical protein